MNEGYYEEENDPCNGCDGICMGCSYKKVLSPEQRKEILKKLEADKI